MSKRLIKNSDGTWIDVTPDVTPDSKIGNLADLKTVNKTSVVGAINEITDSLPGGGTDVTSIWTASQMSGFNDTNFAYKVVKQSNAGGTYTYTITALSPLIFQSTAYIIFDKLPKSVLGFNAEGSSQTNSGIVLETSTSFANTRNTEQSDGATAQIAFNTNHLRLNFGSWSSTVGNQGFCTWKITTSEDLDHYFTD